MKTVSVTKFKTQAFSILADLSRSQEDVRLPNRGRPLALLTPVRSQARKLVRGRLAHTVIAEKDILSPLGQF